MISPNQVHEAAGEAAFDHLLGRHALAADREPGIALDHFQPVDFTAEDEAHRAPAAAGTTGAADPAEVVFGVLRQVVVEDDDLDAIAQSWRDQFAFKRMNKAGLSSRTAGTPMVITSIGSPRFVPTEAGLKLVQPPRSVDH